jgi:hypothetical protein
MGYTILVMDYMDIIITVPPQHKIPVEYVYVRWRLSVSSNTAMWAQHTPASTSLALQLQHEVVVYPFLLYRCFLIGAYISHLLEGRDRLSLLPTLSL